MCSYYLLPFLLPFPLQFPPHPAPRHLASISTPIAQLPPHPPLQVPLHPDCPCPPIPILPPPVNLLTLTPPHRHFPPHPRFDDFNYWYSHEHCFLHSRGPLLQIHLPDFQHPLRPNLVMRLFCLPSFLSSISLRTLMRLYEFLESISSAEVSLDRSWGSAYRRSSCLLSALCGACSCAQFFRFSQLSSQGFPRCHYVYYIIDFNCYLVVLAQNLKVLQFHLYLISLRNFQFQRFRGFTIDSRPDSPQLFPLFHFLHLSIEYFAFLWISLSMLKNFVDECWGDEDPSKSP